RVHLENLQDEKLEKGLPGPPRLGRDQEVLPRRPAVPVFPEQVGKEEDAGDEPAQPDPAAAEPDPLLREQQAHAEAEAEKQQAVLVFEPEAEDSAEEEPETPVSALLSPLLSRRQDADRDQGAQRPEKDVERVHRIDVEGEQIHGRDDAAEGGEELRRPAAAQL